MQTSALIHGCTYYRLTFADPEMTMPSLEPLVYVGLHDSDGSMLHTFQDTISYAWMGRFPGPFKPHKDMEVLLHPMREEEAAAMLSLAEVVTKINELYVRAEGLQFPLLKVPRLSPKDAA